MSHPQPLPPPAAKHLPKHDWEGWPRSLGQHQLLIVRELGSELETSSCDVASGLSQEGLEDMSGYMKDARKTATVGGWAQGHCMHTPQLYPPRPPGEPGPGERKEASQSHPEGGGNGSSDLPE